MSLSRHVYVGPYLRCRPRQVEAVREEWTCPDKACRLHGSNAGLANKHCPECGRKLETLGFPSVEDGVDRNEAYLAIGEALHAVEIVGAVCWMPNKRRSPPRGFRVEADTEDDLLGGGDRMEAEVAWFAGAFGDEIATLASLYGPPNVKVCWGVVAYDD